MWLGTHIRTLLTPRAVLTTNSSYYPKSEMLSRNLLNFLSTVSNLQKIIRFQEAPWSLIWIANMITGSSAYDYKLSCRKRRHYRELDPALQLSQWHKWSRIQAIITTRSFSETRYHLSKFWKAKLREKLIVFSKEMFFTVMCSWFINYVFPHLSSSSRIS